MALEEVRGMPFELLKIAYEEGIYINPEVGRRCKYVSRLDEKFTSKDHHPE